MKIAHVALWTQDIERISAFWVDMFDATAGERYESARRAGFCSRFLSLADGPTFEIMQGPWIEPGDGRPERAGYAHVALSLGSRHAVDSLAERARHEGCLVAPPRQTGDGYYEAVLEDPDGNLIEIIA